MIKNLTKFFVSTLAFMALTLTSCTQDESINLSSCEDPLSTTTCFEITQDQFGSPAVRITDRGEGIGTRTLSSDTVYILSNFVFVNDGQVLTIQPGTVIRGESGVGSDASALIVSRGGQIFAEGTPDQPIIFTSTIDNLNTTGELSAEYNSLWGGLIILGKAPVTFSGTSERAIEGIPTTELRGLYGGVDENDNSGVLRFVSVRHCGAEIGAGNEINGITFGGVGRGTTVENIEVFSTFDDGIEIFGGTVNIKRAIVAFAGDDCLDIDEGYRGNVQFFLAIQKPNLGNRGLEFNGVNNDDSYDQSTNLSEINLANATLIGCKTAGSAENNAGTFRQGCKGKVFNSVFYNFDKKFTVTDVSPSEQYESVYWLQNGGLTFDNNLFSSFTGATELVGCISPSSTLSYFTTNYFTLNVPIQGATVQVGSNGLNPTLTESPQPFNTNNPFFEPTNYVGAFGNSNWASGWSALSTYGIF